MIKRVTALVLLAQLSSQLLAEESVLDAIVVDGGGTLISSGQEIDVEALKDEQTRNAIKFVKLGYGDVLSDSSFRSLSFRTECLETEQAQAVIEVVESYNAFDGTAVAGSLDKFRGLVSCYEFGREGDPVLVVDLPYWTHQREGAGGQERGTKISDKEHNALVESMRRVFVDELHAEEFGPISDRGRDIYFRWD